MQSLWPTLGRRSAPPLQLMYFVMVRVAQRNEVFGGVWSFVLVIQSFSWVRLRQHVSNRRKHFPAYPVSPSPALLQSAGGPNVFLAKAENQACLFFLACFVSLACCATCFCISVCISIISSG